MAKVDITSTGLVWPGKYNEDGTRKESLHAKLPFQVIETVNESRTSREASKQPRQASLFDVYQGQEGSTFADGWRNKLIWGDNLLVMGALLEKFAGKVDLIYIDPPFATGADFSFRTQIGDTELTKEASLLEEKAYRDTWGQGLQSFLQMLYERFLLMRDLLSENGSIYVHIGPNIGCWVRVLLEEVFGSEGPSAEISWKRVTAHSDSKRWGIVHDMIIWHAKSEKHVWNPQYEPYSETYIKSHYSNIAPDGRRFQLGDLSSPNPRPNLTYEWRGHKPPAFGWRYEPGTMERLYGEGRIELSKTPGGRPRLRRFLDEMPGLPLGSVWTDIAPLNSQALDDTGYATQKPAALLERIIKASSNPGDLVADFFCGSGTTMAVAEKLGRRWIGADLGRFAIHTSRKRLLEIPGCKPFEILNLGKYERQYWQVAKFGEDLDGDGQIALYEYVAFILKLYGATPLSGLSHLHGKKGKALIHVGAVDSPITIDEISEAITECVRLKQPELHILGWEWEMGLHELMVAEAAKQGIKLLLLQVPREVMEQQAVDKNDLQFFELAYLDLAINHAKSKKRTVTVTLRDFIIANTDLIPADVRAKVKKWSDYIDYWAIDWDFQNDTFMQGFVTYRTRKDRTLVLTSDEHTYASPGTYRVLVKVIDIFGNDTSQATEVEVR